METLVYTNNPRVSYYKNSKQCFKKSQAAIISNQCLIESYLINIVWLPLLPLWRLVILVFSIGSICIGGSFFLEASFDIREKGIASFDPLISFVCGFKLHCQPLHHQPHAPLTPRHVRDDPFRQGTEHDAREVPKSAVCCNPKSEMKTLRRLLSRCCEAASQLQ